MFWKREPGSEHEPAAGGSTGLVTPASATGAVPPAAALDDLRQIDDQDGHRSCDEADDRLGRTDRAPYQARSRGRDRLGIAP